MNNGLYDWAGASATASAAAWAKRLLPPMTKTSKVYRGLMPDRSADSGAAGSSGSTSTTSGIAAAASSAWAAATASATATRSSTTSSCSEAAASSRLPKCPSIQVFVNSFGTPTTSRSASCSSGCTCENQVL